MTASTFDVHWSASQTSVFGLFQDSWCRFLLLAPEIMVIPCWAVPFPHGTSRYGSPSFGVLDPGPCNATSGALFHCMCNVFAPWTRSMFTQLSFPLSFNRGYSSIKYTIELDSTFGFAIRIHRTRCGCFGIVPLSLCGILGARCGLNQSASGSSSFSSQPRYMQGI